MSEAQTNPEGEVTEPKLSMFDVMFGSEETTNPEQAVESDDTGEEYEVPEVEASDEEEAEEALESD